MICVFTKHKLLLKYTNTLEQSVCILFRGLSNIHYLNDAIRQRMQCFKSEKGIHIGTQNVRNILLYVLCP